MQARFYAPMYGRFLSPDPARDQHFEETQSWNIYSYVRNNPTMHIDPTGMQDALADSMAKVREHQEDAVRERLGPNATPQAVHAEMLRSYDAPMLKTNLAVSAAVVGGASLTQPGALARATAGLGAVLSQVKDTLSRAVDKVSSLISGGSQAAQQQVQSFGSKAEARGAFSGDVGKAAKDFFGGATSKSVNFQATSLKDGNTQFQFFSPANNPGFGKLYVQVVDKAGKVVSEYKDTMGPKGLIERKILH